MIILIVVFAATDLIMVSYDYPENQEGIFWGILGIQFTAGVGVLLFLMQMKSDSRINEIIQKQDKRYIQSKSYLCNEITNKLKEFRNAYSDLLPYVKNFENKKHDADFLKELHMVVVMSDFRARINFIPTITDNVNLVMDKLDDIELGLQIRGRLDSIYGALNVMADSYNNKKDPYCGLANITPIKFEIELIEENIRELEEFIGKMVKEKPI